VFEARVITLCDRDIATNFGVVAGEVILVDSCAIIFICCDCYFFFWKKKRETKFLLAAILFITTAVLFKIDFLVELGIHLLFPKGK
jgi:dolichyl-phosphate-mannose--protein O-mannosyl transferase